LVQPRRNKHASKKYFHRLLEKLKYVSRLIVTDKLGSYAAAKRKIMPTIKHVRDKGANNCAENSYQLTGEREQRMGGLKISGHAQRFLSTFSIISSFFKPGRHLLPAKNYREIMRRRFAGWFVVVHSPIATT